MLDMPILALPIKVIMWTYPRAHTVDSVGTSRIINKLEAVQKTAGTNT